MKTTFTATIRIKLQELIAEGGMGRVYRAVTCGADGFEKVVAVKTLRADAGSASLEAMIREAKLVSGLVHVNIVQIFQFANDGDNFFIVMELVDGISLHELIEFHRVLGEPLPVGVASFITDRIARALAYAHSRSDENGVPLGIVHCDVCPRNIMLSREGVVKLCDFGVARGRFLHADGQNNHVFGKLAFMSPEQAARHPLDFHTDIYSLGMVLFEMLSCGVNARPFDKGMSRTAILDTARKNIIRWDALPRKTPPELLSILHRALADDPQKRFRAAEMAVALEDYSIKHNSIPNICAMSDFLAIDMPARFGKTDPETGESIKTQELEKTLLLSDRVLETREFEKTLPLEEDD